MRDLDIRAVLRAQVEALHRGHPDTRIVEELGLRQGVARVDLAVVNGALHGFEIKSKADTLRRLPRQAAIYSEVLDLVTIVLAESHRNGVLAIVPEWWGVIVATDDAPVALVQSREPQRNPGVNKRALAELLWHSEALEMLRARDAHRGISSKRRCYAWDRLCEVYTTAEVADEVRRRVRGRQSCAAAPRRQ